jgi:hypothetical protein
MAAYNPYSYNNRNEYILFFNKFIIIGTTQQGSERRETKFFR